MEREKAHYAFTADTSVWLSLRRRDSRGVRNAQPEHYSLIQAKERQYVNDYNDMEEDFDTELQVKGIKMLLEDISLFFIAIFEFAEEKQPGQCYRV